MASKSEKNADDVSSGSSNEVTAEWIVKAQLRITQPKKKAASFGTSDCGTRRTSGSPCRVIYKWDSDPKNQDRPINFKNSSEKVREDEIFDSVRLTRKKNLIFRHRNVVQSRPRIHRMKTMNTIRLARAPAVLS